MKHITPLRDDEPTDAELASAPEPKPGGLHNQVFGRSKRQTKPVSVIDDHMRDPTPEQIRSAH